MARNLHFRLIDNITTFLENGFVKINQELNMMITYKNKFLYKHIRICMLKGDL